jgi:hypothetical protein
LTGDVIRILQVVGMSLLNGNYYTVTRLLDSDPLKDTVFTIDCDGTPWGSYISGGIVTPNPINTYITVSDFPDTYLIPFVIPPQERVAIIVVWRTDSPNYVSPDAIAQAAVPEIVDYINSLPAGTTPINLNVLNKVFLDSISTILVGEYVVDIEWTISINEVGKIPAAGTQVIYGDPYSYFYTENGKVQVLKGGP